MGTDLVFGPARPLHTVSNSRRPDLRPNNEHLNLATDPGEKTVRLVPANRAFTLAVGSCSSTPHLPWHKPLPSSGLSVGPPDNLRKVLDTGPFPSRLGTGPVAAGSSWGCLGPTFQNNQTPRFHPKFRVTEVIILGKRCGCTFGGQTVIPLEAGNAFREEKLLAGERLEPMKI
jgi:hypothetical protein